MTNRPSLQTQVRNIQQQFAQVKEEINKVVATAGYEVIWADIDIQCLLHNKLPTCNDFGLDLIVTKNGIRSSFLISNSVLKSCNPEFAIKEEMIKQEIK